VRRRFTLNEDGDLADNHGYVLPMRVFCQSRIVGVVLEAPAEAFRGMGEPTEGEGSDVDVLPSTKGSKEQPRKPQDDRTLRVWDAYVATMRPRQAVLDPQARTVIRDALNVASEEECIGAIRGCAKSAFHMGDNDRHKKYNSLSQILRGKRGIRTTREQIDLMLDIDKANDSAELPSGELAEIEAAKRTIRQYAAFIGELPQRFVAEARQTLMAHGIEVTIIQHEPPTPIDISFSDGVRA
jgi:hypothetical protein